MTRINRTHGCKIPPGLRALEDGDGLPSLPDERVVLFESRNAPQPLTDAVAEAICAHFRLE